MPSSDAFRIIKALQNGVCLSHPNLKLMRGRRWCERCSILDRLSRLRRLGLPETEIAKAELAIQEFDGRCQICGRSKGRMSLDHDHKYLIFRGIICTPCNNYLAFIDNPIISDRCQQIFAVIFQTNLKRRKMYRKFPSLAYPKEFAYAFDSGAFDTKAPMNDHYRMFQTYGDGLTAHSADWSITREHFADYLASLAAVMVDDVELLESVRFSLADRPSVKAIAFAASIHWKEGDKLRYFSRNELKISSSPSKVHDKRYEEIRDFHNGTPNSIFRILIPEYADGLQTYSYAHAIREWLLDDQEERPYMQLPGEFLKWSKDGREAMVLRDAYDACWNLIQAYQFRHVAIGSLNNYKRSLPKVETEAA